MSDSKSNSGATQADSKHNAHPDFAKVQDSRPQYPYQEFHETKTPDPDWKFGTGPNQHFKQGTSVVIDPNEKGRSPGLNYKLLISAITPRPIAFLSTISADGVENLAPFSYFQLVGHDPPTFIVSFSSPLSKPKDSLKNLIETGEATINIISDSFIEAANYTAIDAPETVSEWDLCGLTKADSQVVKPKRVKESVFSIEAKVESMKELKNKAGTTNAVVVFFEGVLIHVWKEALNEERTLVDPAVLRSVGRLGGISYGTVDKAFEIVRPKFKEDIEKGADELLDGKGLGQS